MKKSQRRKTERQELRVLVCGEKSPRRDTQEKIALQKTVQTRAKRQAASGKRQAASGKRQAASGKVILGLCRTCMSASINLEKMM